ncbi:hypothetical protein L2E82_12297 [Cichorium intybus]|uniref:Uncharacterized protein n=2 Tax=Cichorium intybus TaxID=13427 RepID=A0ACB9GFK6_CICIN|nr:hypothetical protein L2E82_25170 [Cichorium intybus]KAI3782257.1 hypothetical protein L2E82_12297 [Cichorium intybus]
MNNEKISGAHWCSFPAQSFLILDRPWPIYDLPFSVVFGLESDSDLKPDGRRNRSFVISRFRLLIASFRISGETEEDAIVGNHEASQLLPTNPYSAIKADAEMLVCWN